jgi:hypothetical protein
MPNIRTREDFTMYDHFHHVMWQQHERRLTAAAERRRLNLEAVERSRAAAEMDNTPTVACQRCGSMVQASPQLATSALC